MEATLRYPIAGFKPLVIESYRRKECSGTTYVRRLRINRFNAFMIDEVLGTRVGMASKQTRFVVLGLEDAEKACQVLGVECKPVNTYFDIDFRMCSFNKTPSPQK